MVKDRYPKLIGVIHLPALIGAPTTADDPPDYILQRAGLKALEEAKIFSKEGFDGVILENFGDAPFYKTVPPETIVCLSVITAAVKEICRLSIGINVLRNDGAAALAIASALSCFFIRINVLSGVAATDQGWIEGSAALLSRERARLRSPVRFFSDVLVKHAQTLSTSSLTLAIEEAYLRAGSDAVVVSGATTGRSVSKGEWEEALDAAEDLNVPLYVGSGVTQENVAGFKKQGVIVSSALRKRGKPGAPLDINRVRAFVKAYRGKK